METIKDLGAYTFPAMLANTVRKFGDRPAVGYVSGDTITYSEVEATIRELRDRLHRLGIVKGDRVAIYATSGPNWGIAYFSIVTLGAIAVPLLPDFSQKEVETCLKHSGAETVFVSTKLMDRLPEPETSGTSRILNIDSFELVTGTETGTGAAPKVEISEQDTASIIYTSGTTGRSKGVELTHKNLVFTAIGGQFFQRINKLDIGLSILPMSHVYEFTIGYLMFFLNGACLRYLEKAPTVTTLLPALTKIRPTIMLSVPIIMEKIYKNKIVPTFTSKPAVKALYGIPFFRKILHRIAGKSLKKTFDGRMKFFGIGGSKVDPVVEQFMKEAKFPYAVGYGLTETSPLLAGAGPKITKPGTIGPGMPGIQLKLIDVDPETGVGELVVKGENVMKGYYRDPELTANVFTEDGWFRTGDLGCFDKKGVRLSLKGRSKNMILGASGENIYPEDIEFVLNQHPLVSDSLVVEGDNSSLVAIVQLDEEKLANEAKKRAQKAEQEKNHGLNAHMQRMSDAVGDAVSGAMSSMSEQLNYYKEEVANEIKFFVNQNVNRISRIDRVEVIEKFEKTASQKIKRYLYNIKKNVTGQGKS
ncbi:MAG: Long-chain-fatty-acid--CoA ligase FadD15 [Spirochaetes bacterium ADurb.Bin269]|nr:MAG: Long-chain-fatty-acid--CoA ligase FadD15 [Spirochaetes bacterium ADurb.Bin269]